MCDNQSEVAGGAIYMITTSSFGQGSPDLGEAIMKSFMITLTQQHTASALIFLNSGVHLAIEGSPVLEQLKMLAAAGVEILVCGACLNYYNLMEKLALGIVTDMAKINCRLNGPNKVITVG